MRKQRPEGMNDKMYRPEYDGPKTPMMPLRPGTPAPSNKPLPPGFIKPMKPGMGRPQKPMRPTPMKPNAMDMDAKKEAIRRMRGNR